MSWVRLPDDEDYLLRPVIRGMCKFESLRDGSVDLADIALMNDALAVDAENAARLQASMEARKQ